MIFNDKPAYKTVLRGTLEALDGGQIGTMAARQCLIAAGAGRYEAWHTLYIHHGGSDVTQENVDGTRYFIPSGKRVEHVKRLIAT